MKKIFLFFSLFFVIATTGCDQLNSILPSITLEPTQTTTTTTHVFTTTTTADRTNEILEIFDSIEINPKLYIYKEEEPYEILTITIPMEASVSVYISVPNVINSTNCKTNVEMPTYKVYTFSFKFKELISEDATVTAELFIRDESVKVKRFDLKIINKSENK